MLMAAHFTYETSLNHCYQHRGLLQTVTDKAIPLSDTIQRKNGAGRNSTLDRL